MTLRYALLFVTVAATLIAQDATQPVTAVNASVSGVVKDKTTGAPLKDYTVTTRNFTATSDESGRYTLHDLPPLQYNISAQSPKGGFGIRKNRIVTVAGHDLDNIDFNVVATGTLTGRVIDDNKDPVPNVFVMLVSREYYLGTAGYFLKQATRTDDLGRYTIANVTAGRPYFLMTDIRRSNLPTHAETPLNPKMRRQVPMRTWYPSSPDREGAAAISVAPGERREAVDIEVKKSPSYCIAGAGSTPAGKVPLSVNLEALQPSSGVSSDGGMFMVSTNTTTGGDGEFRICDLSPGSYRIMVSERGYSADNTYAIGVVNIADRDLTDLRFPTGGRVSIDTEVILEGTQPQTPITAKPVISLIPLLRTQMPGEMSTVRPDIPGTLPITGMLYDDYGIRATLNSPAMYIKDVTYSGRSVRYEPLHLGSAGAASSLRVTVAQDGGTLSASVMDKDGNPAADVNVIVIPAGTANEGVLAAQLTTGQTDQNGQYKSGTLPPGKYYAVATQDSYNLTPESISNLWQSHPRYQEVTLAPSGTAQVNLQLMPLR